MAIIDGKYGRLICFFITISGNDIVRDPLIKVEIEHRDMFNVLFAYLVYIYVYFGIQSNKKINLFVSF